MPIVGALQVIGDVRAFGGEGIALLTAPPGLALDGEQERGAGVGGLVAALEAAQEVGAGGVEEVVAGQVEAVHGGQAGHGPSRSAIATARFEATTRSGEIA